MKRLFPIYFPLIIIIAIVGILFAYRINQQKTATPLPTSTVSKNEIIFPQGGESLTPGKTYTLKWSGAPGDVTQIFLKDKPLESQGESVSLVDRVYDVPNTGSYNYTIPTTTNGEYVFEIGPLNSKTFTISAIPVTYCNSNDLDAEITTEGAAGSIYATFKLTNTSNKVCQILGKNNIKLEYDKTKTTNLSIASLGQNSSGNFVLQPNQTIYSQGRFPNGPQCTQATSTGVSFTYMISSNQTVTYKNQGLNSISITTCVSPKEDTEIQIWNMSKTPITK